MRLIGSSRHTHLDAEDGAEKGPARFATIRTRTLQDERVSDSDVSESDGAVVDARNDDAPSEEEAVWFRELDEVGNAVAGGEVEKEETEESDDGAGDVEHGFFEVVDGGIAEDALGADAASGPLGDNAGILSLQLTLELVVLSVTHDRSAAIVRTVGFEEALLGAVELDYAAALPHELVLKAVEFLV